MANPEYLMGQQDPREEIRLGEIKRPFSKPIWLELHGQKAKVDNVIFSYLPNLKEPIYHDLVIDREMIVPIILGKRAIEGLYRGFSEEEIRLNTGKFRGLFVALSHKYPTCYIGTEYCVELIDKSRENLSFNLKSTKPFSITRLSPRLHCEVYLKTLRELRNKHR